MADHTFHVHRVSSEVHELIQDYDGALLRLAAAKDSNDIADAYAALSQRKDDLYSYIEKLEKGRSDIVKQSIRFVRFT